MVIGGYTWGYTDWSLDIGVCGRSAVCVCEGGVWQGVDWWGWEVLVEWDEEGYYSVQLVACWPSILLFNLKARQKFQ